MLGMSIDMLALPKKMRIPAQMTRKDPTGQLDQHVATPLLEQKGTQESAEIQGDSKRQQPTLDRGTLLLPIASATTTINLRSTVNSPLWMLITANLNGNDDSQFLPMDDDQEVREVPARRTKKTATSSSRTKVNTRINPQSQLERISPEHVQEIVRIPLTEIYTLGAGIQASQSDSSDSELEEDLLDWVPQETRFNIEQPQGQSQEEMQSNHNNKDSQQGIRPSRDPDEEDKYEISSPQESSNYKETQDTTDSMPTTIRLDIQESYTGKMEKDANNNQWYLYDQAEREQLEQDEEDPEETDIPLDNPPDEESHPQNIPELSEIPQAPKFTPQPPLCLSQTTEPTKIPIIAATQGLGRVRRKSQCVQGSDEYQKGQKKAYQQDKKPPQKPIHHIAELSSFGANVSVIGHRDSEQEKTEKQTRKEEIQENWHQNNPTNDTAERSRNTGRPSKPGNHSHDTKQEQWLISPEEMELVLWWLEMLPGSSGKSFLFHSVDTETIAITLIPGSQETTNRQATDPASQQILELKKKRFDVFTGAAKHTIACAQEVQHGYTRTCECMHYPPATITAWLSMRPKPSTPAQNSTTSLNKETKTTNGQSVDKEIFEIYRFGKGRLTYRLPINEPRWRVPTKGSNTQYPETIPQWSLIHDPGGKANSEDSPPQAISYTETEAQPGWLNALPGVQRWKPPLIHQTDNNSIAFTLTHSKATTIPPPQSHQPAPIPKRQTNIPPPDKDHHQQDHLEGSREEQTKTVGPIKAILKQVFSGALVIHQMEKDLESRKLVLKSIVEKRKQETNGNDLFPSEDRSETSPIQNTTGTTNPLTPKEIEPNLPATQVMKLRREIPGHHSRVCTVWKIAPLKQPQEPEEGSTQNQIHTHNPLETKDIGPEFPLIQIITHPPEPPEHSDRALTAHEITPFALHDKTNKHSKDTPPHASNHKVVKGLRLPSRQWAELYKRRLCYQMDQLAKEKISKTNNPMPEPNGLQTQPAVPTEHTQETNNMTPPKDPEGRNTE
jgi:hypothetical protein